MTTMRDQCRCVMHSESNRIVWDGSDCPLHYEQEALMGDYTAEDFAVLRHNLALARRELADLREENGRLERILQDPLLLKGLEAAWENAEQAPKCRKGDVLIVPGSWGGYTIWEAKRDSQLRAARILSRAPKREPWADLGDKLAVEMPGIEDEPRLEALAKALYCVHGVRVTGGGE